MSAKFFINIEGTEHGPFTILELKNLIKDQIACLESVAREEGDSEWKSLSEIFENRSTQYQKRKADENSAIKQNSGKFLYAFILIFLLGILFYYTQRSLGNLEFDFIKNQNILKEENAKLSVSIDSINDKTTNLNNEISRLKISINNLENNIETIKLELKNTQNIADFNPTTQKNLIAEFSERITKKTKDFDDKYQEIEGKLNAFSELKKFDADIAKRFVDLKNNNDAKISEISNLTSILTEDLSKVKISLNYTEDQVKILSSGLENIQRQLPKRR